jgi:hypothetical protein
MEDMDHDAGGDGACLPLGCGGGAPLEANLRVREWVLSFGATKAFTSTSAEEIATAVR